MIKFVGPQGAGTGAGGPGVIQKPFNELTIVNEVHVNLEIKEGQALDVLGDGSCLVETNDETESIALESERVAVTDVHECGGTMQTQQHFYWQIADDDITDCEVRAIIEHIDESKENAYDFAISLKEEGKCREAIVIFEKLDGYLDSEIQIEKCINKIENTENFAEIYKNALKEMHLAEKNNPGNSEHFRNAAELFKTISGYNDSDYYYNKCLEKAETAQKDEIYNNAVEQTQRKSDNFNIKRNNYMCAAMNFSQIEGRENDDFLLKESEEQVDQLIDDCDAENPKKTNDEKREKVKKNRKTVFVIAAIVVGIIATIFFLVCIDPRLRTLF